MRNTVKRNITGLIPQGGAMSDNTSTGSTGDGNGGNNGLETRVTRLEVKVDHIQSDITELKLKQDRMEDKFDAKFDQVDAKFDKLLYWIIGTLITAIVSVIMPIILFFIK